MSTLDKRITELETKIAFLELANQEMSDLIYYQQRQIDRHIRETARQMQSIQENRTSGDPADEQPPHY